ncbi:hypothetical protein GLOIN_2v594904 [Rhizophagus clarus]|uniref:Uncharacterized protein n=1 Tax=Rhizophagus clarus TaxID=94130 RepID=A0A8H3LD98_9GLOM|nr:hypothetical protein GLOIN_2v594904 [Rhizophagus clarus]
MGDRITFKIEQVEVEIKKVEVMLEGVEGSRKKHLDDDCSDDNLINSSPLDSTCKELIEKICVWFREAIRIHGWMSERIKILLNVSKVDPFQEGKALVTKGQVDEWQTNTKN